MKPISLSEEEKEMFRRCDYIELEYLHCEEFRKRRKKTPEMLARLEEHGAEEQKILNDPRATLREAHSSIDHGVSFLLKLIRSKKLYHIAEPTEKGKAAGIEASEWDEAFDCLAARLVDLNDQLIRLAEDDVPGACGKLWFEAKKLAEAFTRLAIPRAAKFRDLAEQSITMPSLRSRSPKFTSDAAAIVKAIHLGRRHPSPDVSDNRSKLGALCHLLVAHLIEEIHFARKQYEWEKDDFERRQMFRETEDRYRDSTLEEVMKSRWHPKVAEHVVACAGLPSWGDNPRAWWKGRVLALVKQEFQKLAKAPRRNPALWDELQKGGERAGENDMRRYLEKICKNKFDQIIRERSH